MIDFNKNNRRWEEVVKEKALEKDFKETFWKSSNCINSNIFIEINILKKKNLIYLPQKFLEIKKTWIQINLN